MRQTIKNILSNDKIYKRWLTIEAAALAFGCLTLGQPVSGAAADAAQTGDADTSQTEITSKLSQTTVTKIVDQSGYQISRQESQGNFDLTTTANHLITKVNSAKFGADIVDTLPTGSTLTAITMTIDYLGDDGAHFEVTYDPATETGKMTMGQGEAMVDFTQEKSPEEVKEAVQGMLALFVTNSGNQYTTATISSIVRNKPNLKADDPDILLHQDVNALADIQVTYKVKVPTPVVTPTDPTPAPAPEPEQPHTIPAVTGKTGLPETVIEPEVATKGQAVYAIRGLYMYNSKTFAKSARKTYYAKQTRVNRPMFVVTGYARSKTGALRYIVHDVNHTKQTAGWRGYITANTKFVVPVYYRSLPKLRVITVINKTGVKAYKNVNLTGVTTHYRKGAHLKVVKIVPHNLTTRYMLSDGNYVTANKKMIIAGRY